MFRVDDSKLLITCCNYNSGLYLLDFSNNNSSLEKILDADCRGIVSYKDKYIMNTTDQGIVILDRDFNKIMEKEIDERLDLHGIAVDDNKAYIVEAKNNCIGIYDLMSLKRIGQFNLSEGNSDIYHLNDLFINGNKLYISMFSNSEPWREIPDKAARAGVILEYFLEKGEVKGITFKNLSHPHSIFIHDEQFFYCNSFRNEVRRNKRVIFKTADYARGLAIYHEFIFIGQSNNRKSSGEGCGIYIFNTITSRTQFIEIPAEEVYGILPV